MFNTLIYHNLARRVISFLTRKRPPISERPFLKTDQHLLEIKPDPEANAPRLAGPGRGKKPVLRGLNGCRVSAVQVIKIDEVRAEAEHIYIKEIREFKRRPNVKPFLEPKVAARTQVELE